MQANKCYLNHKKVFRIRTDLFCCRDQLTYARPSGIACILSKARLNIFKYQINLKLNEKLIGINYDWFLPPFQLSFSHPLAGIEPKIPCCVCKRLSDNVMYMNVEKERDCSTFGLSLGDFQDKWHQ